MTKQEQSLKGPRVKKQQSADRQTGARDVDQAAKDGHKTSPRWKKREDESLTLIPLGGLWVHGRPVVHIWLLRI